MTSRNFLALVLFLAPAIASAENGLDDQFTQIPVNDLTVVAAGEQVYSTHCGSCHGVDLEGQPNWRQRNSAGLLPAPPHDNSGHTWHHDDDLLFEIVKYGPGAVIGQEDYQSAMPAYEGTISDEAIVAVLAYIKSKWSTEVQDYQQQINEGQEGYDASGSPTSILEKLFK